MKNIRKKFAILLTLIISACNVNIVSATNNNEKNIPYERFHNYY